MSDDRNPDEIYTEEIEAALLADERRLGEVFRAKKADDTKSAQSIADDLGIGTVGYIYNTLNSIETLILCRVVARSPTYAAQKAGMLRSFGRKHAKALSETTSQKLLALAAEHDNVVKDEEAIVQENEEIKRELESGVQKDVPGIYVYTYPHYMKHPVLEAEDDDTKTRTYLKIGMSETGMLGRIKQQNTTSMPEPPLVLRLYTVPEGDITEIEAKIHRHLSAAEHGRVLMIGAGKEWFLTHLEFIDSTADLLGLQLHHAREAY